MAEISHDDGNPDGETPRRFFAKAAHIAEQFYGPGYTKKQLTQIREAVSTLREYGLLRLVRAAVNQRQAEYELIFDPKQIEIEKQVYAAQKAESRPRYELAAAKTKAVKAARDYQKAVGNVAVVEAETTVATVMERFQMETGIPSRGIPQHPLEGDGQHPLEGDTQHPLEGDALRGERSEREGRGTSRGTSPEVTHLPAPDLGPGNNGDDDPDLTLAKSILDTIGPGRAEAFIARASSALRRANPDRLPTPRDEIVLAAALVVERT